VHIDGSTLIALSALHQNPTLLECGLLYHS